MTEETKSIYTLEEDLKNLFSPGSHFEIDEKHLKEFSENVKEAVVSTLLRNQSTEELEKRNLRMSSIGKPDRQLWYEANSPPQDRKYFDYATLIKFLYGSILEELLVLFVRVAGHDIKNLQQEHEIEGVYGHQDAEIDGVVVDFKSASGRSFVKFKNGTLHDSDPFGYIGQLSAYAQAQGKNEAMFVVIDKQNGEITTYPLHELEMIDATKRIKHLKQVIKNTDKPEKCYSDVEDTVKGNRKLAIGCIYCQYKKGCWSDANGGMGLRAFKYANGTRFLTQVNKLPNVEEVEVT